VYCKRSVVVLSSSSSLFVVRRRRRRRRCDSGELVSQLKGMKGMKPPPQRPPFHRNPDLGYYFRSVNTLL